MITRAVQIVGLSIGLLGCSAGSTPVYGSCEDSADCGGAADACWEVSFLRVDNTRSTGTFFSLECTSDADCPLEGRCLGLEGDADGTLLCYARCEAGGSCPGSLRCSPLAGEMVEGQYACLP